MQDCWLDSDARDCRLVFDRRKGVFIDGDREVLRRAVENVVMNAIRYTVKGAGVDIELAVSGPTCGSRFGISDPECRNRPSRKSSIHSFE